MIILRGRVNGSTWCLGVRVWNDEGNDTNYRDGSPGSADC